MAKPGESIREFASRHSDVFQIQTKWQMGCLCILRLYIRIVFCMVRCSQVVVVRSVFDSNFVRYIQYECVHRNLWVKLSWQSKKDKEYCDAQNLAEYQ